MSATALIVTFGTPMLSPRDRHSNRAASSSPAPADELGQHGRARDVAYSRQDGSERSLAGADRAHAGVLLAHRDLAAVA